MFEVVYEPTPLKIGTDLVLVDDKWIYEKSEINIFPLTLLNSEVILIGKEKIKVTNESENTLKLFTDFLNSHGHLTLCPTILGAISSIFNYNFMLFEFGESIILSSDIFNTAALTVIKTAINCKLYFTNKHLHIYSTLTQ